MIDKYFSGEEFETPTGSSWKVIPHVMQAKVCKNKLLCVIYAHQ